MLDEMKLQQEQISRKLARLNGHTRNGFTLSRSAITSIEQNVLL